MPCYKPLRAWEHKEIKTKNNKGVIRFKYPNVGDELNWREIEIPCGQCIGCRMDYSKNWAIRCVTEASLWKWNFFVTLTYDDEHLPKIKKMDIDTETGEVKEIEVGNLVKNDYVLFMKRLREHYRKEYKHTNIRFYMAGEYGEKFGRPHYHAILFNCPITDLKEESINHEHQFIYSSKTIERLWGKGIVRIGEVTYQSAAYVRRYIMKKQKGEESTDIREKEFTLMSRRPGIGANWYEKNKEKLYELDKMIVPVRNGNFAEVKPPRYFDKLYEKENETKLEEIKKERRKKAQTNRETKLNQTSLPSYKQLEVEENKFKSKVLTLKRQL